MRWIVRGLLAVTALTLGFFLIFRFPFRHGGFCTDCLRGWRHASRERTPSESLRTIWSAQRDYRENDRDGDGRQDYWRADVAGLYGGRPRGSSELHKLIEISVAGADLAPVSDGGVAPLDDYAVRAPKAGYRFVALRFEDEEGRPLDPQRFAACAVPDSLAAGRSVYVVTHEGVVWEAPARVARDVPRAFPLDPEKAGWRRTSK